MKNIQTVATGIESRVVCNCCLVGNAFLHSLIISLQFNLIYCNNYKICHHSDDDDDYDDNDYSDDYNLYLLNILYIQVHLD